MKLRRLKRHRPAFESELALEVLKSDKLRVTILICAVGVMLLAILTLAVFGFEDFQNIFHGQFKSFLMVVLSMMIIGLGGLVVELILIKRLVEERRKAPLLLPYVTALIETCIPLSALLITAQYVGPAYVLLTPAPFVYPLLIVLSTLRLDFKLCVFTGAAAAFQYWTLSMIFMTKAETVSRIEPILWTAPPHILKGFLFLMTGLAAGAVTVQIKKRLLKSFEIVEERNRISRTFGEYVSPMVMKKLLTLKPDLQSEKREVCVMFLDIRDFTSFAEKRRPEEV
ncbi:MAG TPA: hypothetical protein VJ751_04260, partial [Pyrinomonadaceae bacterium]|nr:hypothetical protein [Pyrinomonadaceae bacterium]